MKKTCCIIPVYNARAYVRTALESVFSQTQLPDEIIVVDDGSTDDSLRILEEYQNQITLIHTANCGVSAALNTAIKRSSADYLSFLDADDIWESTKTARQYQTLNSFPTAAAVFGMVKQFVSEELDANQFLFNKEEMPGISKLTMMIRREFFLEVGYFDETLIRGDFIEWFSRFTDMKLEYKLLPSLLAYRRLRNHSLSSKKEYELDLVKIMRQRIKEKRRRSDTN